MKYELFGSTPSPFVRRIRMAMESITYEFKPLNIYEGAGKTEIGLINPARQIPTLMVNDQPLFDSRIILQYIQRTHTKETLSLEQENQLSSIERMIDAGVVIFMLRKSELSLDHFYGERLNARIESVLEWLEPFMTTDEAKNWNSVTQLLYAALDWMKFREIHPQAQESFVQKYLDLHSNRPIVQHTDPRL